MTIKNVFYVRDIRINLINVTVIKLGCFTLVDKGYFISSKKGTNDLYLNIKYTSGYSYLMVPIISVIRNDYEMISRVELHEKLVQPGYNIVFNTTKYLGLNIQNNGKEVFEEFSITKTRR